MTEPTPPGMLATPEGEGLLVALRAACRDLPGVTEEVDGFGHTSFRVRGKSFVIAGRGKSGTAMSIKCDLVNQGFLVQRGPYFRTPYIGQHGWISVERPLEEDWEEITSLIADAWVLAAPKRLVQQYERRR